MMGTTMRIVGIFLLSSAGLLNIHAQQVCENSVADVILLVDTSGSIDTGEWSQQIQFIRSLVNSFTIGHSATQLGIVTFSNVIQNEFSLTRYTGIQGVLSGIDGIIQRSGTTHTSRALAFARTNAFNVTNGDRTNAPNTLIVITDGESSVGYEPSLEAALLKQAGVKIIAIGIGSGSDRSELEAMASSHHHLFEVPDFTSLGDILGEVRSVSCEVDGGWSLWSSWSDCNASCGNGTQYRERTCTNPSPSANGIPCQGPTRGDGLCFTECTTTTLAPTTTTTPTIGTACENSVADIVFLVDTSGSVNNNEWAIQIQFVRTLVSSFRVGPNGVQVGIVTFSHIIQEEFPLNRYTGRQEVMAGIDGIIQRSGTTHTSKGLSFVRTNAFNPTNGDRPNAPNILIVITDGVSTLPYQPYAEAALLKQAGVKIIAIGIGSGSDRSELEAMASSERHLYEVTDFTALSTILSDVHTATCVDYPSWSTWGSWSDCSQSCGNGTQYRERTCNNPSPPGNGVACPGSTREEIICFTPCPTSESSVNSMADIVMLVDTSGSIATSQWQEQIQFIRTIVDGFTIGPHAIQIGIVTFSDVVQNEFCLNTYAIKPDVLAGINAIIERSGSTYTSRGIAFVRTTAFTLASGDRPNAPNILIVITDGESSPGYDPNAEAALLKQTGVKIVAIGVGSGSDRSELEAMASSQRHVFEVMDFAALSSILSEVVTITYEVDGGWSSWGSWSDCSQTCGNGTQYRQRTCTNPPPSGNGAECQAPSIDEGSCFTPCPTTPIQVDGGWSSWGSWSDCSQTCGNGTQYRHRTCTNPPPSSDGAECQAPPMDEKPCFTPCPTTATQVCSNSVVDLVFLVDTSGSISANEWALQIQFIRNMVNAFTIGPNAIQLGIVTFATTVNNEFHLNRYTGNQDVLSGIDGIIERSGYTHTSSGLRFVRTNSFDVANGDRANAPNALIVITDGRSTRSYEPNGEAALLKQSGVRVIAIGIGTSDRSELEVMASSPRHVFDVADFTALTAILNEVLAVACEE